MPRASASGRRKRFVALCALVFAAVAPCLVFREVLLGSFSEVRLEFGYLVMSWTAWVCFAAAVLFFVPVVISAGRDPYSRWFIKPALRHAYEAWGLSLYVLGVMLAVQMSQSFDLV